MSPLSVINSIKNLKNKYSDNAELELPSATYGIGIDKETIKTSKKFSKYKQKKFLFAAMLTIVVCSSTSSIYFFTSNGIIPENKHQRVSDKQKEQEKVTSDIDINKLSVNPFIEISKGEIVASGDNIVTPAGNNITKAAYQEHTNRTFPSIPKGYQRPNMPNINKPVAIPSSTSNIPKTAAAVSEISGIMTGDKGESIAIMSDGNIVMAGETYNDNRIAYIGGDGIHFKDGSSIEYK